MYAFCLNSKYPGYFFLCFKAGQHAPLANWPVKVVPKGFELKGNKYPDMRGLKNGFKVLFAREEKERMMGGGGAGAGMAVQHPGGGGGMVTAGGGMSVRR